TTGASRWVKDLKPTNPNGNTDYTTPAVANGLVYALAGDYKLWAFGAGDGRNVWTFSDGVGSCCALGSPVVANGLVYFTAHNGTLYALNAMTGARVWSVAPVPGAIVESTPAVANGVVYLHDGGKLFALDAATGATRWSVDAGSETDSLSSPAVV